MKHIRIDSETINSDMDQNHSIGSAKAKSRRHPMKTLALPLEVVQKESHVRESIRDGIVIAFENVLIQSMDWSDEDLF